MKRLLVFILLTSALAAFFSCAKNEIVAPVQEARELIITATREDDGPATKTELVGSKTYWSVGDKISVFFGSGTNGGAEFTSLNTEPSASADFTGVLTAVTGSEDGSSSMKYFWGVYPYSTDNSVTLSGTSNYLTTVVDDVQYGVADSYSPGQNIWVGRNYGLDLSFKSLLSGIKFTFTRNDITRVTIQGKNGEDIAGKVNVVMDGGVPVVSGVVAGKKSVTLRPKSGGTFQKGAVYRALFLPTNFTQGLTVTFYTTGGSVGTREYVKLNFERNAPKSASDADSGATWEAGEAPEYVDMGGGHLWATKNVGADSPEDTGYFFAWGETSPKDAYRWNNYAWGSDASSLTRYVTDASYGTVDNRKTLLSVDDAAQASWGDMWYMPTKEDWDWLKANCDVQYNFTQNGVNGCVLISKINGNSLFFPYTGLINGASVGNASYGYYWSSSLGNRDDLATYAYFSATSLSVAGSTRFIGFPVRPVYRPYNAEHEYVEMGDGHKWATMDIGANAPWEIGERFAWGETEPRDNARSFLDYEYKFGSSEGSGYTKYNGTDGKSILDPEDDAATANWGGKWRMPTRADWTWLEENCTITHTYDYNGTGVGGLIFISMVPGYLGNQLFFPCDLIGDIYHPDDLNIECIDYWSSELEPANNYDAYYWEYLSSDPYHGFDHLAPGRDALRRIRPVSE